MCYVYANLCVKLCEGINGYKFLPKHKTIIEDPDNIIQDKNKKKKKKKKKNIYIYIPARLGE